MHRTCVCSTVCSTVHATYPASRPGRASSTRWTNWVEAASTPAVDAASSQSTKWLMLVTMVSIICCFISGPTGPALRVTSNDQDTDMALHAIRDKILTTRLLQLQDAAQTAPCDARMMAAMG